MHIRHVSVYRLGFVTIGMALAMFVIALSMIYVDLRKLEKDNNSYIRDVCTTRNLTIQLPLGVGNVIPNATHCTMWSNVVLFHCTSLFV